MASADRPPIAINLRAPGRRSLPVVVEIFRSRSGAFASTGPLRRVAGRGGQVAAALRRGDAAWRDDAARSMPPSVAVVVRPTMGRRSNALAGATIKGVDQA